MERTGRVRTEPIPDTTRDVINRFVYHNISLDSVVYTDEHRSYIGLGSDYVHGAINHSIGEYVNGKAHTNGIESFWALLKRGYYGIFHHFSWKHLRRYLSEFEMRWNMLHIHCNRVDMMLESVSGCRLTYQRLTA